MPARVQDKAKGKRKAINFSPASVIGAIRDSKGIGGRLAAVPYTPRRLRRAGLLLPLPLPLPGRASQAGYCVEEARRPVTVARSAREKCTAAAAPRPECTSGLIGSPDLQFSTP